MRGATKAGTKTEAKNEEGVDSAELPRKMSMSGGSAPLGRDLATPDGSQLRKVLGLREPCLWKGRRRR